MDFSEISKWKNLTKNWMLFMKNSSENTVLDESWKVGSTSFRFKEIVCLLEPEYIKFLKLCLSELSSLSLQQLLTTYQELPLIISHSISCFSFLSKESIHTIIQLLFQYQERLDYFLSNPPSNPLEREFIQRGMDWCMTMIDNCLAYPIQLNEDTQSLELNFLLQAIHSVHPPIHTKPFESTSSFSISEYVNHHVHSLHMIFQDFDMDTLKEHLINAFSTFSSLSFATCTAIVSMIESLLLSSFSSPNFELQFFLKLICSHSIQIASYPTCSFLRCEEVTSSHSLYPLIEEVKPYFITSCIQPKELYRYRRFSLFISRQFERELFVASTLFKGKVADEGLCMVLLCIWGVTPSQDYLQSFMNLINIMLKAYNEPQFYDDMFSVKSVEGIPAYYYYLLLIYLYLLDDRAISVTPIHILLDADHLHFLRCILAYCEIRRETILCLFSDVNEINFTRRIKRMDSIINNS